MTASVKTKDGVLVLLSGGQDSATCLFWALRHFGRVEAIGFDYGQRHRKELNLAASLAREASVPWFVHRIDVLNALSESSLINEEVAVDTDSSGDGPPNSLVEGRNLLFLTYAAIYGKTRNIDHLVIGAGQTDYSGYPDCRDEFMRSAQETLSLALDRTIHIHTPLMWMNKEETWALAADLGVLDLIRTRTLTCYNGIEGDGCGNCPACRLRQQGYNEYLKSLTHHG